MNRPLCLARYWLAMSLAAALLGHAQRAVAEQSAGVTPASGEIVAGETLGSLLADDEQRGEVR